MTKFVCGGYSFYHMTQKVFKISFDLSNFKRGNLFFRYFNDKENVPVLYIRETILKRADRGIAKQMAK